MRRVTRRDTHVKNVSMRVTTVHGQEACTALLWGQEFVAQDYATTNLKLEGQRSVQAVCARYIINSLKVLFISFECQRRS